MKSEITRAANFSSATTLHVSEPSLVTQSLLLPGAVLQRVAFESIIDAGESA